MTPRPPISTLFPYTTLFRSDPDYATGTEFGSCVMHGMLLASLFSQLMGIRIPGTSALYLGQDPAFRWPVDRKSTRLNSSHLGISYAVFCLKKQIQYKLILLS